MRRVGFTLLLGALLTAAPLATGEGEEEQLKERLRALEKALHKAIHEAEAADGVPAANVSGYQLGVFPVADLATPRYDHIAPQGHRLSEDSEMPLFGGLASEGAIPFGTVEELLELVRSVVWPESWEEGSSIVATSHRLIAFSTRPVLKDLGRYLDNNLRPRALRCVTAEAEVVTVPLALYNKLLAGEGSVLSTAQRHELEKAIEAKAARRVFGGRVTGLTSQRIVLWHGEQIATVGDADVEVAEGAQTSDPVISVVQAGGSLSIRAVQAGTSSRMRVEADVRLDEIAKIDAGETERNGALDLPRLTSISGRVGITLPSRTWAIVATGRASDGMRLVLLRVTPLQRPQKGAKR
ncbi:MAG: hypothetical protein ACYTGN_01580 [Planctomycetota bacterium]|jgi:hypothetical protein